MKRFRSPWPPGSSGIERMTRIDRQAVVADVAAVAFVFDRLQAIVARFAERAQRTEDEGVPVAGVGRVVIGDRRRRDAARFLAQGTQRLDRKLVVGPSSPGLERVPISPVERLRGCEIARMHRVQD